METRIFRVVRQGEPALVQSKVSDRQMWKCNIVLREVGGLRADEFVATMIGADAQSVFRELELVAATLRFETHEYQGRVFQDALVTDIVKLTQAFS